MKKIYALIALAITSFGFAQSVEIFNNTGVITGDFTTWTFTNNINTQIINQTPTSGSYLLIESGNPGDVITTSSYDTSGYINLKLNMQVATYGSGANNPAKIEVSYDNGVTFTDTFVTNTPTSSTYINSNEMSLSSSSNNVVIKITNNGTSGKGVRLKNIILTAEESEEETPVEPVAPTASFDLQEALTISPSLDDASSFFGNAVVTIANLGEGQTASLSLENTENFEIITPEVTDLGNGTHSIQIRFNAQGLAANTYTTNLNVEIASQTTALATLEIVGVVSPALSNNLNTIEGLNIYPNPANDVVTITSAANGVKNVQLFDVTGKQIINVETSSTINVSSLAKGIYVMKVTEAGKSATSKLVIK